MKKFFSILMVLFIAVSLVACGAKDESVVVRDFPEGDYAELGQGTVYISTPGGTSEDGNIPVIYSSPDSMKQIGLNAWDFNGNALSYVYIDGMLNAKVQLANTQTSITLEGAHLAEGIHTIEVVQYEGDEPGAEMIAYKSMQYEVKAE